MSQPHALPRAAPAPTADDLRQAYRVAVRGRVLEEHIVRLASRGEVKFAIWGPGEEVHGAATALALRKAVDPRAFAMVPHYRSGCLCGLWCELNGKTDFARAVLRQQFSRGTDEMSRGRQMVYHLDLREVGILPVQSPVGMQLGKAAGYALGFRKKGIDDAVVIGIIGDGTTAEGDLHEAMNAASVWSLPLIVMVTDNGVAISTRPEEGRGIKDFAAYAEGFGVRHLSCDGRDFGDVYETTWEAATWVRSRQRPVLLHVRHLPRFNGHSSAADMTFDLGQPDPLVAFGEDLVRRGLLGPGDVLRRSAGEGRDFFAHHDLGAITAEEDGWVRSLLEEVRAEGDPDPSTLAEFAYPPFPEVAETPVEGTTAITYAGAIRAALDHIVRGHGGVILGQDVARLGGVMQATAGLLDRNPGRVIDSPLNEPLILGTACGMGLHDDLVALPEIQFGDYALNAFHWLVHMGNLYWTTAGNSRFATILRTPVDPFGGGAVYHSMSLDGYFAPIPGLVILMPSTSWDVFGLLMTAADYRGPVVVLEPKWMYRQALGPAFPGEPSDPRELVALKKHVMRGGVPEIPAHLRVPFGKGAVRREGEHVTVVAWGRAVWTAMRAADALAAKGVSAEVIDLRTLVPPDLDAVFQSVSRTGRLVVASEDRPFAGFVRTIQGKVVERYPEVPTRAVGQMNLPGIAQAPALEAAAALSDAEIVRAVDEVMARPTTGRASGWAWIPPRYFLG